MPDNPVVNQNRIGDSGLKPYKSYTYADNSKFYTAVPKNYWQYYNQFVREWFHWYDGYVPWLHTASDEGIFSTRLATTICRKLAKNITGGRLLYDDGGKKPQSTFEVDGEELKPVEFVQDWAKKTSFDSKLARAVEWALAGGDVILKAKVREDGPNGEDLAVEPVRKDNYLVDLNTFGDVTKFSTLVYNFVKTSNEDSEKKEIDYFIMEERRYNENGQPEWRLSIKEGKGGGVSYKGVDFHSADFAWTDVSKEDKERLKEVFGKDVKFNEWERIKNFDDLGVYFIRNTEGVSFHPSLPFGESIISNAIHILMSYDYYFSAKNTDMYLGRGKVLLPRGMDNPAREGGDYYDVLKKLAYERIPYTNPDEQKPVPLQFDLRSQSWKEIRDNLLQELALSMDVNPRTIATFIVPTAEKPTAHEISTDEHETAVFVEDKRDLIMPQVNKFLKTLLKFYGFDENDRVDVKFSKKGVTNLNTIVNHVTILKQNGLIDDKTAMEMYFYDKNERQIQEMMRNIEKQKEKNQERMQPRDATENDPVEQQEQGYNREAEHVPKPEGEQQEE